MRKPSPKAIDARISRLFHVNCSGMPIAMSAIPALFRMARALVADGASDEALAAALVSWMKGAPVS